MIHYCYVIHNLCISGNAAHSPFQNSDAYALASHFLCLLVVVREYQTEVIVVPALLVGFFVILLTVILWLHCRGLRTKREGSSASEQQGNHHSFQRKACWFQWSMSIHFLTAWAIRQYYFWRAWVVSSNLVNIKIGEPSFTPLEVAIMEFVVQMVLNKPEPTYHTVVTSCEICKVCLHKSLHGCSCKESFIEVWQSFGCRSHLVNLLYILSFKKLHFKLLYSTSYGDEKRECEKRVVITTTTCCSVERKVQFWTVLVSAQEKSIFSLY